MSYPTILHSALSAKTTAWNEFSSTMTLLSSVLPQTKIQLFQVHFFELWCRILEGGVKFLMYPRFVQVFLDKQVEGMSKHKGIYVTPSHTNKVFANMKRQGKDFSGRDTQFISTMTVEASRKKGNRGKVNVVPSLSGLTNTVSDDINSVATYHKVVLDLEKTKISQAAEITKLKKRVKRLEKKGGSITHRLRRLLQDAEIMEEKEVDMALKRMLCTADM
ncbi:hypothetical protein Tco_0138738 [Tanacetum coccineum]